MKVSKVTLINLIAYTTAIIMSFVIGGIIILIFTEKNPLVVYNTFFAQSFFSKYGILEIMARGTPIFIAGAGMVVAWSCGLFNLGAEGQMAIGAIVTTYLGINLYLPPIVILPLIFLVSFIGGALWSGIAGLLKYKFSVNEMISTLMLNYIAIKIMEYMIDGPMSMPNPNYPRTSEILPSAQMKFIQYPLNYTIVIAVLIIPVVYFIINKTTFGYMIRAVGLQNKAAKYSGMNIPFLTMAAMLLGGGISALAGTTQIIGDFFRMERNVTGGYGFIAIIAVVMAKNNVIGLFFVSLLISGVIVGGQSITMVGIPATFSQILLGIMLICFVVSDYFKRKLMAFSKGF